MSEGKSEDEFERRFLVKTLPKNFAEMPAKEIHDIYFPYDEPHCRLRLRKSGSSYEMTKKEPASGTDSSHLIESTIPLTLNEFESLASVKGKSVRKVRYYFEENETTFEIGVFKDALEGLVIADAEFSDREVMEAFQMPDWLLSEVTQEGFLAGGELAGKSYVDIEERLRKSGYIRMGCSSTP